VGLLVFASDISVLRVDPDKVRLRTELSGTERVVEDDGFDRRETREEGFFIGVVRDGGGRGGVVVRSAGRPLISGTGCAASVSVAARCNFSKDELVEYLYAPRGTLADSFANMLRTEDTILRLPRAVAELTRFRTG
jgi:hypothetical protein